MNLLDNKLETLLAVNEFKSFTTAAKFLNLTQPAVSQHISLLEQEFGIKIFNKNGNTLVLTAAGAILIKYARRIKAISKELNTKLEEERNGPRMLKVGITHSLEGNIITEILTNIAIKNGRTTIKIYSDDIKNLYDKLSTFEIDLAIVEGKVNTQKFSRILLDTDYVMAVMSKNNKLAKNPVVTIKELQDEKLILRHSKSATRTLFAANLEENNLTLNDFNVLVEIDNAATIKDLVAKDMGVSILPKSICVNDIKNKTLVAKHIKDMDLTTQINLLYNKNSVDVGILEAIIKAYETKSIK